MNDQRNVVREVAWRELFPWLLLFRTFRLALSLPLLTLGTLAALLMPLGWRAADKLFLGAELDEVSSAVSDWKVDRSMWPGEQFERESSQPLVGGGGEVGRFLQSGAVIGIYREGLQPFVLLLRADHFRVREWAYLSAGAIWTIIVWGWLGGAINRVAVVRLGCDQAVGFLESLRFSRRRLKSYLFAPLLILIGVILASLPGAFAGLLMRSDVGVFLSGLGWILVLLSGFIIVILLAGLGLGWPLMWGAIGAETEGDEFEAIQRSVSYALGRPLHYLFYALLVTVLGAAGVWIVDRGADATIAAARWSAEWGAGSERWQEIQAEAAPSSAPDDGEQAAAGTPVGVRLIDLSEDLARTIALGFRHSFFWCAAAGIYLLLRRDVDETELDEIYLENLDPTAQLPPLGDVAASVATTTTPPDAPSDPTS